MKILYLVCLFFLTLTAEETNPIMLYSQALETHAVEEQSLLLNRALTGFLDQKPQNPSALWHFDIGGCFLALHEAGPAVFHFLEAQRIDPDLPQIDAALIRARTEAHVPGEIEEIRPLWVLPFITKTTLEIWFLVSCLCAFAIGSLGLFMRYSSLITVCKWLAAVSLVIALFVVLRFLQPLEGVVVYPVKLLKEVSGEPLARAMLPGEQVRVINMQENMIQVVTIDGQTGWLSDKTCWILSIN